MELSPELARELLALHYDRREKLFEFAATLAPEELTRPVECTWGSILGILLHAVNSEEFWFAHVLQKGPRPRYRLTEYPALGDVRRLANQVRERTMAYVTGLSEEALRCDVMHEWAPGSVGCFTVSGVLLHVFTHEFYHRGQALLLANVAGHDIPDLDLL